MTELLTKLTDILNDIPPLLRAFIIVVMLLALVALTYLNLPGEEPATLENVQQNATQQGEVNEASNTISL